MSARTLLISLALLLSAAAPANAAIVVNEVESSGIEDFIELYNTGFAPVDIGGWVVSDSNNNNDFDVPVGTTIAAGGFYLVYPDRGAGGFGLSGSDAARVFDGGNTLQDGYSWTSDAPTTYGRCPDGTGAMQVTSKPSPGAANTCPTPVAASAWPGGATIATGDVRGTFGDNMSGLAYQPSGTGARGTLWAVRNDPGTLFKLVHDGTNWVNAPGWAAGKTLHYPTGFGNPDSEGVTLAGDANGIYVAVERDGGGGSAPRVLRFDTASPAATLTATNQYDIQPFLDVLGPNQGPEAIAWVPDDVLVAKGFYDESKLAKYNPANYPGHGTGVFFVGIEQDGSIAAFTLAPGAVTKVATIPSGFINVQDLEYEPETKLLWAACDNSCDGRTATLDVDGTGRFAVTNRYERPADMPNLNNEGFAIAPQAECVNSLKPAFWLDDTNASGYAIRLGTIRCTVPTVDPDPTPVATVSPQPTASPTPAPPVQTLDRTAPKLRLSLTRPARNGKLRFSVTLDERSDLTITATARKNARAKVRTLTTTTRRGVAAGKPSYTLTLSAKVRKALKKGETVTLTVTARDAAGNVGTARATGKVR